MGSATSSGVSLQAAVGRRRFLPRLLVGDGAMGEQVAERPWPQVALARLAVIAVMVGLWAIAVSTHLVSSLLVSSPWRVVTDWVDLIRTHDTQQAIGQTAGAIGIAFLIGTAIGIFLGFVIGSSPIIRKAYYPPLLYLLSTPKVVFVPIFLLLFGIGPRCVAAFGAFQAMFYVAVPIVGGMDQVGAAELRVSRAFGAGRIQKYRHLIIPAITHTIFSAIWIGIIEAFIGALVVELFVSAGGVGSLITKYEQALRPGPVIALALTLAIACIICGQIVSRLERVLCRWPQ